MVDFIPPQMDPGHRPTFRGARLVPGLFECGLLLCWGAVSLSTLTVSGIVGESALLPCVDSTIKNHALDEIRVYWQMADQLVHAFHSGKEHVSQDYSNRARLFTKEFKQGNFSLLLSDLRVSDEAEYICVIQMKQKTGYDVVLSVSVSLQIAAHYMEPVLSAQCEPGHEALVKLHCSSWGGYPEPLVYWTDDITNTLPENSTVKNDIIFSHGGLYNVTSVLWIQATSYSTYTCSIYNPKLQKNKTATLHWNISEGDREEISISDTHHGWITPVVLVTLILVVSLACYILLKHFPRSSLMRVRVAAGQCELASLSIVNPTLGRRSHIQDDQDGTETEPFTKDLEDHKGETET
ncbi:CD276 antigen-like isoform X1 [Hemiscyllium ocellatum]|uniref:CD276 antigen-like isoform X1 n=1 Tax=Hemiscyllium ocellatum TaxID=170820 RepID=UPI0029674E99|nr:CD276 antigen-like isoform X1 [Hemiscyllium ocellatum]